MEKEHPATKIDGARSPIGDRCNTLKKTMSERSENEIELRCLDLILWYIESEQPEDFFLIES